MEPYEEEIRKNNYEEQRANALRELVRGSVIEHTEFSPGQGIQIYSVTLADKYSLHSFGSFKVGVMENTGTQLLHVY